jgi:protein phosphatase
MAIQLPQPVTTNTGWESDNGHELYLASIGDSRAYWITPYYCQLLTIDDDMATKIVSSGKSLYRQAMTTPQSNALTQALGIKEAESLDFNIKRFILEEDGVLLLCSDGLSDNDWVEKSWQDQVIPLLTGKITVEDAVHKWVDLAKEKNGQDNISVVVSLFRNQAHLIVTPPPENGLEVREPEELLITVLEPESETPPLQAYIIDSLAVNSPDPLDLNLTLEGSTSTEKSNSHKHSHQLVKLAIGLFVLFLGSGGIYLWTWREFQPRTWNQICQQLPEKLQQLCLKQ